MRRIPAIVLIFVLISGTAVVPTILAGKIIGGTQPGGTIGGGTTPEEGMNVSEPEDQEGSEDEEFGLPRDDPPESPSEDAPKEDPPEDPPEQNPPENDPPITPSGGNNDPEEDPQEDMENLSPSLDEDITLPNVQSKEAASPLMESIIPAVDESSFDITIKLFSPK